MKRSVFVVLSMMTGVLLCACTARQIVLPAGYGGVVQAVQGLNWAFYLALFLLYVTLGWVCLYVAWRKGHSPVGFFFFGFFLFVPAIITIACLKPKNRAEAAPAMPPAEPVYPPAEEPARPAYVPPAETAPSVFVPPPEPAPTPPAYTPPETVRPPEPMPANPVEAELLRLRQMKERGKITEEEYQALRKKTLGL
jgi:hypothetical protein